MGAFGKKVPGWPLSQFVEVLWCYEGEVRPHAFERILPDGSVELVVNLRDDRFRVYKRHSTELSHYTQGCLISGPRSDYCVIDTAQQLSTIGVHFKPGGAFPFLRMPATEVQGMQVCLRDLWGPAADEMRDRLLEAPTMDTKFDVLEECLLRQATGLESHRAVEFALNRFQPGPPAARISEVTDQIGLSPRRFIQLFEKEVGLTPKLFCRVRRFQQVIRTIGTGRHIDWADVALACGYFDQAHFIHDFRAFSGLNPSTYVARRTEHLNHVPLEAAGTANAVQRGALARA